MVPRATLLALTAVHPPPAQPITAARGGGDYWLGHCEGFKVQSPEGDVGVVESVVYAADAGRPAYLAVTGGRLRLRTALVPCGEVVSIDARQTRLDVQARPARRSLRTTVAGGARRASHHPAARDGLEEHMMSRGEMIRRLDDASRDVHEQLENGPLSPDERHVLAATLTRLLPTVADSLQDQEDREAAQTLLQGASNAER